MNVVYKNLFYYIYAGDIKNKFFNHSKTTEHSAQCKFKLKYYSDRSML